MHLLTEPRVHRDVPVVPEPALDERGDLGRGVDLDLLRADHRPAALGLDAAHVRVRRGIAVAHAVAVRHLEEPVAGGDGADLHRLEQDIEARLAHEP